MNVTTVTWTGKVGMALAAFVLFGAAARLAAAQTVTRGPYLQQPTSSTMTVRWRTDVATNSRVAYGAAPGSLTQTVDDGASTTEHVVMLTGLSPATRYYYSVGSIAAPLAGGDGAHFFSTAPPTGTPARLRIWTIGDAGFTGADLDAVRDAYPAYTGSSHADLFLLLGDNAYLIGSDAQYQAAVFDAHAAMLRSTPVWSVFGNHEAGSSNSMTQIGAYFDMFTFPTAGEAGGVASGTESYYAFDYANVHFIVLDSEQAPPSASTPMLTWLDADLAAATADWTIVLWHRPPYSRGLLHNSDVEMFEIRMRQFVLPVLEAYGVDLVLCGHSHSYERSYFLDGHYGLSSTFSSAYQIDAGDGDPVGDGAYGKASLGPLSHSGAVYVVNGSGSEVRPATLNHPAMRVGLLELGSMLIEIQGGRLTARFLNDAAEVKDRFRVEKGPLVPATSDRGLWLLAMLMATTLVVGRARTMWRHADARTVPTQRGRPDRTARTK